MAPRSRNFSLVAFLVPFLLLLLLSSLPSADPARDRGGVRGGGRGGGRAASRSAPRVRRGKDPRSISPAASGRSFSASSASSAMLPAAATAEKLAGCSCYTVRNTFCCWQSLCVCSNVCYNGSALVGDFGSQPCIRAPLPEAPAAAPGKGGENETPRQKRRRQQLLLQENPLAPVTCRRLDKFRRILRITLKESPIDGIGQRDKGWRKERERIEWRSGTTYLQPLDADCLNIASFFGKVGQILLVNNASKPALPHAVDRFMFPRAPQLLQALQAAGKDSWHVVVLRQLLGLAVAPMLGEKALRKSSMAARRFLGTDPLAGGIIEFEPAFEAASETRPLCFAKVVIPGKLKAITYPGGPSEAEMFKAHLGSSLALPNPPLPAGNSHSARAKPRVQLLFIRRNRTSVGGRRIMDDGSDGALYDLFYDMGFKIRRADFTRLSFRQQYEAVLNAEVIVGVHGAGLTSAAAFARNRSVVLEIMPHNTFNPRYYFMALQAGVTYFLHQLRPGAKQPLDEEFETLTVRKCSGVPDCRKYFYEDRLVNVTKEDLEDLKVLLEEARLFVRQARWNLNWAGGRLKTRYETLCSAGKARDIGCRMDLIRSPVADVKTECVMKMDCLTVKPMLADDLDDIM
ncbi:hypothetical protein CLOM_g9990 [Closterium sp. NIES-68]|nr:hypothetical protein CLOM_g9990 [Closterium sp. NIES-68]GJP68404.1 hypothetical protein CLOP_g25121 [Closterium sp. NIES-67]